MSDVTQHFSFEHLIDLVEQRLSPQAASEIQAHLAVCSRCDDDVAWLNQTLTVIQSDELEEAPPHVVARAVRLLRSTDMPAAPTPVQRVRAALSFDSSQVSPAFGFRSVETEARQLLFTAGDQDLDIRVAPRVPSGRALWVVSGQVLGPPASGRVELRGEQTIVETTLSELSEFVLPPVPEGEYVLTFHMENVEIELGDLELRRRDN